MAIKIDCSFYKYITFVYNLQALPLFFLNVHNYSTDCVV